VIPSGTVAYIINKNFINFFKNEFMIIKDKADWPVKFFKKSLFLMVSPQLIKTNQHGSLIQKNIEIKFTKIEASHLIRKVKRIQNYKLELYKIYIREIKIVLIYLFMKKSKYKQRGFW
jgi:GT2 family glycosyltransferase